MTGYYSIAQRIPAETRKMMLEGNFIFKAVANEYDSDMIKLYIIYANYIEPYSEAYKYEDGRIIGACQLCLTNILDKFKLLEPYLIQLERESNLIES